MRVASADICNLGEIYSQGFNYSLPRPVLESFLDGKAFDHKISYTIDEKQRLDADIHSIYASLPFSNSGPRPLAVITAGPPGAGKTTLMLDDLRISGLKAAYICPDDVCLKKMDGTYQTELHERLAELLMKPLSSEEKLALERDLRQELYNKWRPASNAAVHLLAAHLIRSKADFYFGMTASSPATAIFFRFLKEQGYQIKLLHLTAPDSVRWGSVQERDKVFVQTTEQDIVEKGVLVPQRILDTYLKYADEIEFYYRPEVKGDAILAAEWVRGEPPVLTIYNAEAYGEIKKLHNAVCETLKRPDLLWEMAVEKTSLVDFVHE